MKKTTIILGSTLIMAILVMITTVTTQDMQIKEEFKVSDDMELVGSDGTTYPVYEKIVEDKGIKSRWFGQGFVSDINCTINSNGTKSTKIKDLRKDDKVWFRNMYWDDDCGVHIGIKNETTEYYSSLNSGSFNGYMTVKKDGDYSFYVKNTAYNKITVTGSVTVE